MFRCSAVSPLGLSTSIGAEASVPVAGGTKKRKKKERGERDGRGKGRRGGE